MSWLRPVDRWLCVQVIPYQHTYHALARRLTGSHDVARDIVQDVYAEVLSGDAWKKALDAKAFVLRIVYCRSIDWVNRQKIVPIHPLPAFEGLSQADYSPDAFERLSGREELAVVLDMLDSLPPRCREVVMMRRIDELPPREIARRLGINVTTVERHLGRGLSMLAERLAEKGSWRRRHIARKDTKARQAE